MKPLHDLFIHEIQDLFSVEQQILEALPKLIEKTSVPKLREALEDHFAKTKIHVKRLEEATSGLDIDPEGEACKGMEGLLKEGEYMVNQADEEARDAAIIAACQKVEHYEIAGYGTALAFAQTMKHDNAAKLLKETLKEEKEADELLSRIAEKDVNKTSL